MQSAASALTLSRAGTHVRAFKVEDDKNPVKIAEKIIDYLHTLDHAIEQTYDVADSLELINRAQAVQYLTRKIEVDQSIKNRATASVIRSQARLGDLLLDAPKAHGARPPDTGFHDEAPQTYEEMGIDKNVAYRCQTIAKLPKEKRERFISEALANDSELTVGGIIAYTRNALNLGAFTSSDSAEHYTPQKIIAAVIAVMGAIDLDPCSNSHEKPNVPAAKHYTIQDNGLTQPWHGRVFCNPPYGDELPHWVDKLNLEYLERRIDQAILLAPARTDTVWFRELKEYPRCFLFGRLTFIGSTDPALFPSMLVSVGCSLRDFKRVMRELGDVYVRLS